MPALTNAQKQAAHRARLRRQGLVNVNVWATIDQAAAIKAILSGDALPAQLPFGPRRRLRGRKNLSAPDRAMLNAQIRNREIIEQHKVEIERMERDSVSRTDIREWLEKLGADFQGKTTRLNALLGPRL